MALTDGTPIWFELTTADPQAAAGFYEALLGWTTAPSPMTEHGGYIVATAPDGDRIAGIMAPPPGAPPSGGWSLYFLASDIAATVAKAAELGGKTVFGPMDIPHVGRFAVIVDSQGIPFSVMQPDGEDTARPFKQMPGALGHGVWIELATPDPDGAFAFYGGLFGWTKAGAMPMDEMGEYAFLGAGDARPGAVMSSTLTRAPQHWNMYFLAADIDAAIATAEKGGGQLIQGPDQIPGGDYSANIVDPAGHQIGLVGPRKGVAQ
ncbi:VOC family protein [Sphingomonas sp. RP10(2022)]|uniref:VOC family protein n=1 Tax=Sphingomonas liriopis TaxID=2949094 RepID=A0A9X2KQK4_9SPHN|nr:VOC family protein [Sphingomonas liriopis]MCP3734681.1 VOC family protein [Sphingomonas liriopis]